jgi:hypothetical protein
MKDIQGLSVNVNAMNNAIRIAIEKGGYEIHEGVAQDAMNGAAYAIDSVVLNPKFWQALGKALGWDRTCVALQENGNN